MLDIGQACLMLIAQPGQFVMYIHFSRNLTCEATRPPVANLMKVLSLKPAAVVPQPERRHRYHRVMVLLASLFVPLVVEGSRNKKISLYFWSSFLANTFFFSTILKRSLMSIGYNVNVYINPIRPVQVCADGFNSFLIAY
jgi:hypothetical protein